jgi:hypothetical protein
MIICANVIEYFPRVLLISGYPRMQVQFDGENKTRTMHAHQNYCAGRRRGTVEGRGGLT